MYQGQITRDQQNSQIPCASVMSIKYFDTTSSVPLHSLTYCSCIRKKSILDRIGQVKWD